MKIAFFIMTSFFLLCGCGKDSGNSQSDTGSNPNSNGNIENSSDDIFTPNNIFKCQDGATVGIDIHFKDNREIYDYYINEMRLNSTNNNKFAIHPDTKYQYYFELDLPKLTVFIADPTGAGVAILSCRKFVQL